MRHKLSALAMNLQLAQLSPRWKLLGMASFIRARHRNKIPHVFLVPQPIDTSRKKKWVYIPKIFTFSKFLRSGRVV